MKDMAGFFVPCADLGMVILRADVGVVAASVAFWYVSARVAGKGGRKGR